MLYRNVFVLVFLCGCLPEAGSNSIFKVGGAASEQIAGASAVSFDSVDVGFAPTPMDILSQNGGGSSASTADATTADSVSSCMADYECMEGFACRLAEDGKYRCIFDGVTNTNRIPDCDDVVCNEKQRCDDSSGTCKDKRCNENGSSDGGDSTANRFVLCAPTEICGADGRCGPRPMDDYSNEELVPFNCGDTIAGKIDDNQDIDKFTINIRPGQELWLKFEVVSHRLDLTTGQAFCDDDKWDDANEECSTYWLNETSTGLKLIAPKPGSDDNQSELFEDGETGHRTLRLNSASASASATSFRVVPHGNRGGGQYKIVTRCVDAEIENQAVLTRPDGTELSYQTYNTLENAYGTNSMCLGDPDPFTCQAVRSFSKAFPKIYLTDNVAARAQCYCGVRTFYNVNTCGLSSVNLQWNEDDNSSARSGHRTMGFCELSDCPDFEERVRDNDLRFTVQRWEVSKLPDTLPIKTASGGIPEMYMPFVGTYYATATTEFGDFELTYTHRCEPYRYLNELRADGFCENCGSARCDAQVRDDGIEGDLCVADDGSRWALRSDVMCYDLDTGVQEANTVTADAIICGDSIINGDEECDDGNTDASDDCTSECRNARCGDGFVGPGELCDDGNNSDSDSCRTTCVENCRYGCGYAVRGNTRIVNGRVEVRVNDQWGTVCDDGFSTTEAQVVCQSLGYHYGRYAGTSCDGEGPIWVDDVDCSGDELSLLDCDYRDNRNDNDCTHSEDACVECVGSPTDPRENRTVGDYRITHGRVEMRYRDRFGDIYWGTICDDGWADEDARVFCRTLGFTDGQSTGNNCPSGDNYVLMKNVACTGDEQDFSECEATHGPMYYVNNRQRPGGNVPGCNHSEDACARCIGDPDAP